MTYFETQLTTIEFGAYATPPRFGFPKNTFPEYLFRYTTGQFGVVITSDRPFDELDAANLRDWMDCFVVESIAVGPQLPPTRLEQFNRRARHITAQWMIVLAILGWILPILPGTPFFLLAWALGWRPPGSKHSVPTD